ncbi:hypothetical protein KIL84_004828 [Mauremys mutica]|uniref:Uncharacterized protein n=1 Tax=Mauremys mutica TaxID=74926 RepID=A0A9D3XPT1_9SAUR|nr:hypothetical protein KIL84_004828 [Mauremys mutica]
MLPVCLLILSTASREEGLLQILAYVREAGIRIRPHSWNLQISAHIQWKGETLKPRPPSPLPILRLAHSREECWTDRHTCYLPPGSPSQCQSISTSPNLSSPTPLSLPSAGCSPKPLSLICPDGPLYEGNEGCVYTSDFFFVKGVKNTPATDINFTDRSTSVYSARDEL